MKPQTGMLKVWLSPYSGIGLEQLKSPEENIKLTDLFFTPHDMPGDYILVGEADVTVRYLNTDAVIAGRVDTLKAELQQEKADSYVRQMKLEEQIQNLLALPNFSEVEA